MNRLMRVTFFAYALTFFLSGCDSSQERYMPEGLFEPITVSAETDSSQEVTISWTKAPGAHTYAVYRCQVAQGVSEDLITSTPVQACGAALIYTSLDYFIDAPTFEPSVAYVYHIKACVSIEGQNHCGPVLGSVATALEAEEAPQQMSTTIGDDGRQVISGLETTLHAFAQNSSGEISWNWRQESGPKATLSGSDSSDLTFIAPVVDVNTSLSFVLRAEDENGPSLPVKTSITVVPANNISVQVGSAALITQVGHEVTLHARGSKPDLQYQWQQVAPQSPIVELLNADTDNPHFLAPDFPQGGSLLFEVIATDPSTGQSANSKTLVQVQHAVPTITPILEPNQVPDATPTPVPIAAPLLVPLQIAQPLKVPPQQQLAPVPNSILVPPKVTPQALLLLAPPLVIATQETRIQLSMTAQGGQAPYQWQWSQTSGPQAVLIDEFQSILTVELPAINAAEVLTFEAKVTDALGNERTAKAVVHVTLVPETNTTETPTPITPLEPRLAIATEQVPVLNTSLTDVQVEQTSGPALEVTVAPTGDQTTRVSVTAPQLKTHSAQATLSVRAKNAKDEPIHYIIPVLIMRVPSMAPAPLAPPQILPTQNVPQRDDPLVIIGGTSGATVDEGSEAILRVTAQGGKGSGAFTYSWTYIKENGGPDITLFGQNSAHATFDAPAVDRPTLLRFKVEVSDGAQSVERDTLIQVNDLSATLTSGALSPLVVKSGQTVNLSAPTPSGGVLFATKDHYRHSITQLSGPRSVTPMPINSKGAGRSSNWQFTTPTLAAGAADEVYQFEFTSSDRVGNIVKTTQEVTVKAPEIPAVPLVANISAPSNVALGAQVSLQGDASGGTPPYDFAWEVTPNVQAKSGRPTFNLPTTNAQGQNPRVTPDTLDSRRGDIANYQLAIKLTVTDANQQTSEAMHRITIIVKEAIRPGIEALICGDLAAQVPCTDLDLVIAQTYKCPDSAPYAVNSIIQIGSTDRVLEFRYCADAAKAYSLFILGGSKDNPLCRNFDPARIKGQDITCHLACYKDGCNTLTNPPDDTLIGPVGSDGFLSVGQPPLPSN